MGIAGGKRSADAFATWALDRPTDTLVVEDASRDPELHKALSEAGLANVRFYAAVRLTLSSGQPIGALCVMGDAPRTVPKDTIEQLKFLGDQVIRTSRTAGAEHARPGGASAPLQLLQSLARMRRAGMS